MIQLHYHPGTASMAPHILLEEIGGPYQRLFVDKDAGALDSAAYRALNPNGKIPVLVDGDLVLYESAAICLHLADTHPAAGLLPAPGSAERAQACKWLVWLTNTLQATLIQYFYPERQTESTDAAAIGAIKARAALRVTELLGQLDDELARNGGPWLLGERYGIADAYAFMLCRWTRNFAAPARPARALPHIAPWQQRVLARPAVQRMFANEGLNEPWF
jgi:glutathione S-transferase